jgi:hypothetical protein
LKGRKRTTEVKKRKMRKKLLAVVAVCLTILLGAIGAYAYISTVNQSQLVCRKRTYSFYWEGSIAEKFNVTEFWLNVTFDRINATHLTLTIKTNHLRYDEPYPIPDPLPPGLNASYFENRTYGMMDYVGVCGNPHFFSPGMRYGSNEAWSHQYLGYYEGNQRFLYFYAPHWGAYGTGRHTQYFDPELGYSYSINPAPIEDLQDCNVIHIEYDRIVAVEFAFPKELLE